MQIFALTGESLGAGQTVPLPTGRKANNFAWSPDGKRLAVCYDDSGRVSLFAAPVTQPPSLLATAMPPAGGKGNCEFVSWSADGGALYASGGWSRVSSDAEILKWPGDGSGPGKAIHVTDYAEATYLTPRQAGGVNFVIANFSGGHLEALDAQDRRLNLPAQTAADFRNSVGTLAVSQDGGIIQFKESPVQPAVIYSIAGRSLTPASVSAPVKPPLIAAPGLVVQGWKVNQFRTSGLKTTVNGTPLPLNDDEVSLCLAVASAQKTFVLGTGSHLRCFDALGHLKWNAPGIGTYFAVNVSGDGKVAVAALGDGTIRWYRMTDGKELLTFVPHADGRRWVAFTYRGYYDASPGGEDLIGWHVNRAADQAADFFPASRFRDTFYRPDVVARVLGTQDEVQAVQLADAANGRKTHDTDISKQLPPVVAILSPDNGAVFADNTVTVQYSVRTPSGDPVQSVRALVNGRPIPLARRIELTADDTNTAQGATKSIDIPLPAQDCTVSLVAYNKNGASEAATIVLHRQGGSVVPDASDKPTLYVLAVGVGKYPDPASIPTLTYPAKDAQDFVAIQTAQKGKLYHDVQVRLLTDEKATKDAILDGLDWIKAKTTKNDVAAIFLSGHGANDSEGRYVFIPINFDRERLARTGLSYLDIKSTIENIAGKTLFFVDSCHSGGIMGDGRGRSADVVGAVNDLSSAENGAIVFTASTSSTSSLESPEWGNGAFTKAIVEGMNGQADFKKTHSVTVKGLDFYISDRVKELTHGAQLPTTSVPPNVPDYTVADTP